MIQQFKIVNNFSSGGKRRKGSSTKSRYREKATRSCREKRTREKGNRSSKTERTSNVNEHSISRRKKENGGGGTTEERTGRGGGRNDKATGWFIALFPQKRFCRKILLHQRPLPCQQCITKLIKPDIFPSIRV